MVLLQVERLGKAAVDSLTTSSEEAAADPTNLKGKSSDNKPDGTEVRAASQASAVPLNLCTNVLTCVVHANV
jgi:hypothetical protein